MRIVGVIDLKNGQAVHARGGDRARYEPVDSAGVRSIPPGDGLALARAYVEEYGITELYVADLDAIERGHPQRILVEAIAALGAPLWLDAGITSVDQAQRAVTLGAHIVIVGLETMESFAALREICEALGRERVAFSLDLRAGQPVTPGGAAVEPHPPDVLARMAVEAGAGSVILLDLARVGMLHGPDFDMVERVRAAVPGTQLFVGGGISGPHDLARLAGLGCDGTLVATALHDGRLRPVDLHSNFSR